MCYEVKIAKPQGAISKGSLAYGRSCCSRLIRLREDRACENTDPISPWEMPVEVLPSVSCDTASLLTLVCQAPRLLLNKITWSMLQGFLLFLFLFHQNSKKKKSRLYKITSYIFIPGRHTQNPRQQMCEWYLVLQFGTPAAIPKCLCYANLVSWGLAVEQKTRNCSSIWWSANTQLLAETLFSIAHWFALCRIHT